MLILMLTLKNIRMKVTVISSIKNFFLPPITNLEINFTKSLKRDYPFYPQLTCRKVISTQNPSPFTCIKKFSGGGN